MTDLPELSRSKVIELSGLQRSLHAAFLRKSSHLAEWYMAALQVLNDSSNPDRYAQAAHSLREIMEKFPECAGQTVRDIAGNAANIIHEIHHDFTTVATKSMVAQNGFSGTIEPELQEVLVRTQKRIVDFCEGGSTRNEQARATYRHLVPGIMAPVHEESNLAIWKELRSFFANVAHHKFTVSEEALRERLLSFEQIAGAQLMPRPTDDMSELDQLIKEAEGGN